MQIFIDESGTFSGFHDGSISVVGALCIPHSSMRMLEKKYLKLRERLPIHGGEVKGRELEESQVAEVVELLRRNRVIFEASAIDLGVQTSAGLINTRDGLIEYLESKIERFNDEAQPRVRGMIDQIRNSSLPLFLQAMVTISTLENVISHVPLYYSQRQPKELGEFTWTVDAKDPSGPTDWEMWWATYCQGVLASRSKTNPGGHLIGADYSFFDRYDSSGQGDAKGTDLELLLSDVHFSAEAEMGLELVDILTNSVRRAMKSNLQIEGWGEIRNLMIHRPEPYILAMILGDDVREVTHPAMVRVLRHFSIGGKDMVSPHFRKIAAEEE